MPPQQLPSNVFTNGRASTAPAPATAPQARRPAGPTPGLLAPPPSSRNIGVGGEKPAGFPGLAPSYQAPAQRRPTVAAPPLTIADMPATFNPPAPATAPPAAPPATMAGLATAPTATPPAAPPTPAVQGPGPDGLPMPGVQYPESRRFTFPAGYGSIESIKDGMSTYSYSTPEQKQARADRATAWQQRIAGERDRAQMREYQDAMTGLMNGGAGRYGNMSPQERAAMMGVISGQMDTLRGVEAERFTRATDPARRPEHQALMLEQARLQVEKQQAEIAALDPNRPIDLLKQLNADPALRAMYLANNGVPATDIASLPQATPPGAPGTPGINAGNLGTTLEQPQNIGMKGLLAEELPLEDRIARAAQFPGFDDINSPTRQMFDAWLKQRYAGKHEDWRDQMYVPHDPDDSIPVLGRVGGFLDAAILDPFAKYLGGNRQAPVGTGLFWRRNHEDAVKRNSLIDRYAISPFG